jgi:hypothetical protein
MSVADISDGAQNPAASPRRMWIALAGIGVLALLAWFTLDGDAAFPVAKYSIGGVSFGGFDLKVRWVPELILGLFAVRIVTANMRARLEAGDQK